jgi:hypothetical protein
MLHCGELLRPSGELLQTTIQNREDIGHDLLERTIGAEREICPGRHLIQRLPCCLLNA